MERLVKICYAICLVIYYCFRSLIISLIPKRLRYKSIVGENVVITGGAGSLGQALALRFAKFGANVIILDMDKSELNKTKTLVEMKFENSISAYVCDITDRHMVYRTGEQILKDSGFVSILVNNAGVLYGKSVLELSDDNILNTFNVNTLSNFWTIKAFLPNMLTANKGHIVTIASICGKTGSVQLSDYSASKHAVIGLNDCLSLELQSKPNNRIETTLVLPTFFKTKLINGIKSTSFITVYDFNYVADQIIDAVLTDEPMLVIPNYLNLYILLKSLIPVKAMNKVHEVIGGFDVMKNFKQE